MNSPKSTPETKNANSTNSATATKSATAVKNPPQAKGAPPAKSATATKTKAMPKQNRFKSWALWAGLAGAVWLIMTAFGLPERLGLTNDSFNNIVSGVGIILTLLGVVNNPTDPGNI